MQDDAFTLRQGIDWRYINFGRTDIKSTKAKLDYYLLDTLGWEDKLHPFLVSAMMAHMKPERERKRITANWFSDEIDVGRVKVPLPVADYNENIEIGFMPHRGLWIKQ